MGNRYLPSKEDEEKLRMTIDYIHRNLEDFEIVDVGSTAKGTWLANESDIDLYIFGSDPFAIWEIVQHLFPTGHIKKGKLMIWNVAINGIDVDFVVADPSYKKREDTSKHTEYFKRMLTKKMIREVRKAKALFKTYGVYGAENGGIVGVAIEELMVRMGNLGGLCKMIRGLVRPYIQDPTMTEPRDLLANITKKRWKQLQKVCEDYLAGKQFKYRPMATDEFLEQYVGTHSTQMYKRKFDKGLDYQTAQSNADRTKRVLLNEDRSIEIDIDTFVDAERILICYRVRPLELSEFTERCVDPKLGDVDAFMKVHEGAYTKLETREVCAMVRRRVVFPDTFFSSELDRRMKDRGFQRL